MINNTPNVQTHLDEKTIRPRPRNAQETLSDSPSTNTKNYYSGMFCGSKYELKSNNQGVIAVDFDGTLAKLFEPYDPRKAGPPLNPDDPKSIFNLTRGFIKNGKKVIILTARMNSQVHTPAQLEYTRKLISAWTKKYLGKRLPCTAEKHYMMTMIYDDRAISINPKTGRIVK
jgi:hypothetical protein